MKTASVKSWWPVAPIVVAVLVAFGPVASNGFINIDDDAGFLKNSHLGRINTANLRWALTSTEIDAYQPLPRLLALVESSLWGLDPRGYHVVSLILHATVAVALFALTRELLRRGLPDRAQSDSGWITAVSGLAALVFAVHPLRTEVVAWAICQAYLPCGLLNLLAVLCYVRWTDAAPGRVAWWAGSVALFWAALGCYQNAVGLPLVLLILDIYPLRRRGAVGGSWRDAGWLVAEKLPYLAGSLCFGAMAVLARRRDDGLLALVEGGVGARILQASYATWFYLIKSVVPTSLSHAYPLRGVVGPERVAFLMAFLGVIAASVGALLVRKRWPALMGAWLAYLVILAPNSGLVRSISVVGADRYSYLATMTLVPALAAALWVVGKTPGRRRWEVAMVVGLVVLGIGLSQAQSLRWRDSVTLWQHAISLQDRPEAFFEVGLGRSLGEVNRWTEAQPHLAAGARLAPHYSFAHSKYGESLIAAGEFAAAETELAEACRLDPSDYEARSNLGCALSNLNRPAEAEAQFAEVARMLPGLGSARSNLGATLLQQGKTAAAEAQFAAAVRIDPDRPQGFMDLGFALAEQGKFDGAATAFARAAEIRPDDADAHHNLAYILARLGRLPEADAQYIQALRLNPNHEAARRGQQELRQFAARTTGIRAN